ncbi:MAG: 4-hydroxy-3-methylbut-2-enyl diphosphate reductase [Rhodospirillaceae bacterium]|nr:4-hydroxy-3-methylbut-2-enyl diphosphate reductase [Rhodospirillaceae bacterium]
MNATSRPPLTILLAAPRGFCAGVDRAILVVERALEKFGAPVYVRHEIVHNRHVVDALKAKGAVFVDELDEVPDNVPVIFSAHGVPKSVPAEAESRKLVYVDATCPLVSKVHVEAERHAKEDKHIFLIGHARHPEVIGTMGQVEPGTMTLIETVADVARVTPPAGKQVAYVTQTTLSVDDTADIIAALRKRFPEIAAPRKEDICYATTNRQSAVKAMAKKCDAFVVIGAPNSSNSNRLVEVAQREGCADAFLVEQASSIPWERLKAGSVLGVTAGASAPEILVEDVITTAKQKFDVIVEEITVTEETVKFSLPRVLNA